MGDLPYISSEQGGLIIRTELIYEYTIYKRPIRIQELRAEEGGWAYNTSWAYNTYYTVHVYTCMQSWKENSLTSSSTVYIYVEPLMGWPDIRQPEYEELYGPLGRVHYTIYDASTRTTPTSCLTLHL